MSTYKTGRPTEYSPSTGKGTMPPEKPGEYRIVKKGGGKSGNEVLYIGETNNLKRRMNEHQRSGKLGEGGTIAYQPADGRSTSNTRRTHEASKIKQHNPPLNKSKGGEGRIAKRSDAGKPRNESSKRS